MDNDDDITPYTIGLTIHYNHVGAKPTVLGEQGEFKSNIIRYDFINRKKIK